MSKKENVHITLEGLQLVTVLNYSNITETNGFYGKEVYFTDGFQSDILCLFQALGNVGAYARDKSIDTDSDYIVISNSIMDNPDSDMYNSFVVDYETKLNQNNSPYRRVKLITENHLIWYLENRAKNVNDVVLLNLIKRYKTLIKVPKQQDLF